MNPTTHAPRNAHKYNVRTHRAEAGWNIVEALLLIWKQIKALFRKFDHALFADEAGDKPQKPESLQDIEPIDPRSWLKRVLTKAAPTPTKDTNVYSEPFETPRHFYDEDGRWDAVPDWKWILPCALFWIVVFALYYWLA
jgi:hypothetical protein